MHSQNGFRDTEIGSVPTEWLVVPLRELVTFTRKPPGLSLSNLETVPFIPMELVPNDGGMIATYELRPGRSIRSGTYCEEGDFLLAKITPSFENGKQGFVGKMPGGFAYATTEVFPIRAHVDKLDIGFLASYLCLHNVRADIAGKMEGSTGRQRVPKAVIENYLIPLPPLPEQRRIAHILSTIQRAIQAQDAVITAARELKRSLMHRLFTYGPYAEPLPTKETEIGEVPEGWEIENLGDLADIEYGIQAAVAALTDPAIGVPILTNINLTLDGTIDYSILRYYPLSTKEAGKLLQPGDVLFNWRSGSQHHVGKTAIFSSRGPFTFSSFILRFRAKERVTNEFLARHVNRLWSQGYFAQQRSQSSVNSVFNKSAALDIPVLIPSYAEQSTLVSILVIADKKLDIESRRKNALEALFKSMLHQLMTGQVRVAQSDVML